jgi:hypothetical protein
VAGLAGGDSDDAGGVAAVTALAVVTIGRPRFANVRVRIGGLALARGRELERTGRYRRARPWLVFANVLSLYDLTRAVARSRSRAYLQATMIVVSLVASLALSDVAGWQSWLFLVAGVTASAVDFGFEVRGIRAEDANCLIMDLAGQPERTAALHEILAADEHAVRFTSSLGVFDPSINAELARQSLAPTGRTVVRWDDARPPLSAEIEKWRRQILLNRYRNARGNRPFNGDLVRQVTDLASAPMPSSVESRPPGTST